jgi:D-glycero-D-manno-heptose 1,7-bisphosphate phosphatase
MNKAIFIDKDGTLITDVPYNADPALIRLEQDAAITLKTLKEAGYLLIIISNQSGVALGYFEPTALRGINEAIQQLLQPYEVQIDAFYYCPHHPQGNIAPYNVDCACRKPAPGLLQQAIAEWGIDAYASWMIGDILNDVEAGNRAGCQTILLNNGNETEWLPGPFRKPDHTVQSWCEIQQLIATQPQPVAHAY